MRYGLWISLVVIFFSVPVFAQSENQEVQELSEANESSISTAEDLDSSKESEGKDEPQKPKSYILSDSTNDNTAELNSSTQETLNNDKKYEQRIYDKKRVKSKYKKISDKNFIRKNKRFGPKSEEDLMPRSNNSTEKKSTTTLLGP